MKKFLIKSIAILLATLTTVLTPLRTYAASEVDYIEEIRLGYGEEGRQALKEAGFILWEKSKGEYLNVNEGGTGSAVYIGYKTTRQKEDAITDVAVMPMGTEEDRAYSFEAYAEEMAALSEQIDEQLNKFDAAIEEFRANYRKPAPENDYALRAYQILNMYTEDDTKEGLGDLFVRDLLDETDTKEEGSSTGTKLKAVYHNVLMMGNSTAVAAVKTALALGCTETGGTTFLDRLKTAEYTGEVEDELNSAVYTLAGSIETFRETAMYAKSVYDTAESYQKGTKKGTDAYILSLDEADRKAVLQDISLVEILKAYRYGDVTDADGNQLTFMDVISLPTEFDGSSQIYLDAPMLSVLAEVMTPGQIAVSQYAQFDVLVSNAHSTTYPRIEGEDGIMHYDLTSIDSNLALLDQVEPISVYTGVDRTVFSDYKTVAITDATIRSKTVNEGLGVLPDFEASDDYTQLGIAGSIVAGVGLAALTLAVSNFGKLAETTTEVAYTATQVYEYTRTVVNNGVASQVVVFRGSVASFSSFLKESEELGNTISQAGITRVPTGNYNSNGAIERIATDTTTYTTSLATKVTAVVGAVAMAIGIALAIYGFVMANEVSTPQVDYTRIPRAIIDVKTVENGDDLYFVYYASKTVNTTEEFDEYYEDYLEELNPDAEADDSLKYYGDVNGLNTEEPWLGLYYAKDLRLGSPLTTNILVKSSDNISTLKKTKCVPIHNFFNNTLVANNPDYTAFNLNATSYERNAAKIYIYFNRDLDVPPLAASLVDETASFDWLALVTFVAGAGVAAAATAVIKKKKKAAKA